MNPRFVHLFGGAVTWGHGDQYPILRVRPRFVHLFGGAVTWGHGDQ